MKVSQGGVELARGSNGWTLWRITDTKVANELDLLKPWVRPVFVICNPEGVHVHELVYTPENQSVQDDYLHVMLHKPDEPFGDAVARKISISALSEVLGLRLDSKWIPKSALLVPRFHECATDVLASEASGLPRLIDKVRAAYEAEQHLPMSQRERLETSRIDYTNASLSGFAWGLKMDRFRHPFMTPIEMAQRDHRVVDVRRGEGIIQNTSYQLVLHLDFLPDPSWGVRVEQEYVPGDTRFPPEVLSAGAIGPAHALLEAGLLYPVPVDDLRPTFKELRQQAESTWLDAYLADAPSWTERYDVEAYRLLNTVIPYLWPLDAFVAWVQGQEPRDAD